MVGIGKLSVKPITQEDIKLANYPSMDEPFKSVSCSERGSQIVSIDSLIKNVTDSLEESWNTLTSTLSNVFEKTLETGMNGGF